MAYNSITGELPPGISSLKLLISLYSFHLILGISAITNFTDPSPLPPFLWGVIHAECKITTCACTDDPFSFPSTCGDLPSCATSSNQPLGIFVLISDPLVNIFLTPLAAVSGLLLLYSTMHYLQRSGLLQSALIVQAFGRDIPAAALKRSTIRISRMYVFIRCFCSICHHYDSADNDHFAAISHSRASKIYFCASRVYGSLFHGRCISSILDISKYACF